MNASQATLILALLASGCFKREETAQPQPRTSQSAVAEEGVRPKALDKTRNEALPLEILVENAAEPFSRPDGTGYANEVVRAAFDAVGVRVTLTVVPYVRCKAKVLDGSAALCFSMSWDPAFEGMVKFADSPLFSVRPVYFESASRPLKARSEDELGRGVRIGTVRSYEYPVSTIKARERGALFVDGPSAAANLKKLAAGRLDAAIVMVSSLASSERWLDQAKVQKLVREAFRCPSQQVAFLGASTVHPRGLKALERYNRGMEKIKADGTLDQIIRKWESASTSSTS